MVAPAVQIRDEITPTLTILPTETGKALKADIRKGGAMVVKAWQLMLSGPATPRRLGIRSGNLRRSVAMSLVGDFRAEIAPDASHAWLGAHEFGVKRDVSVRGFTRREHRRRQGRVSVSSIKSRRTRSITGEVTVSAHAVRSHSRFMNLPKRPSRAPAVKLVAPAIDALFRGDVAKAVEIAQKRGKRMAEASKTVGKHLGPLARRGRP